MKNMSRLGLVWMLMPILLSAQNYEFGPNVRVNDDPPGTNFHSAYSPGQHSIAARGDTVYLVWRDDRSDSHVYFARSNDAGQHFSGNVRVDNTPSGCAGIMPSLAVDDSGTIHVSWNNYNSANHQFAYYAKSTNGGQSFMTPVRACDSLYLTQAAGPSIAVSRSGQIVYVVRHQRGNPPEFAGYQIFLSRSTNGGATFLTPDTRVSLDSSREMLYPTVAAFGDSMVLIAWQDDDTATSRQDVSFSRSRDAGATFSPFQVLSDTTSSPTYARRPSIGVDASGRVHVVFMGSTSPNLCLATSGDTGATFGTEREIPSSYGGENPSLFVVRDGRLYVSWYTTDVHNPGEWFTFSPDGGSTFPSTVTPLDVPVTESTQADLGTVTANEQGRVFAAWGDNRYNPWGFDDDIMFATGVMSGVEDTSNLPDAIIRCEVMVNPARGSATVCFSAPTQCRVNLEVFDECGRRVRVLMHDISVSGQGVRTWDGCDERGIRNASGVYIIRLSTPFGNRSKKVMLMM